MMLKRICAIGFFVITCNSACMEVSGGQGNVYGGGSLIIRDTSIPVVNINTLKDIETWKQHRGNEECFQVLVTTLYSSGSLGLKVLGYNVPEDTLYRGKIEIGLLEKFFFNKFEIEAQSKKRRADRLADGFNKKYDATIVWIEKNQKVIIGASLIGFCGFVLYRDC